jgi:hypothetical protein
VQGLVWSVSAGDTFSLPVSVEWGHGQAYSSGASKHLAQLSIADDVEGKGDDQGGIRTKVVGKRAIQLGVAG